MTIHVIHAMESDLSTNGPVPSDSSLKLHHLKLNPERSTVSGRRSAQRLENSPMRKKI